MNKVETEPVVDHSKHRSDASPPSMLGSMAHYIPSVFFRTVVGVVNTVVRPKLLNPYGFGLWSLFSVIPQYASYLHLGSRDYMRFAVPKLSAPEDRGEVLRIEASVFWGVLAPNLGVAAALALVAVFGRFSAQIRIGLAGFGLIVVLTCLYEYAVNLLKGHQRFKQLSRAMYMRNMAQLVLSVVLMLRYEFYGLLVAVPLSLLLPLIYMSSCYPFLRVGRFSWPVYREMVAKGLPLALFAFLMTLMLTSGRLLVAAALSPEEVGYYALGALALKGLLTFPGATREVVEPRIMQDSRGLDDAELQENYLYGPLVFSACCMSLVVGPLFYLLPGVIEWLLPAYVKGIAPLRAMLIGFYFMALIYPLRGIVVARGMQRGAAILVGLGVCLNVVLSLLALRMGYRITGVAVASATSYMVLFVALCAFLRVTCGIRFPATRVWPVGGLFCLICMVLWGMWPFRGAFGGGVLEGCLFALLQIVVMSVVIVVLDFRFSILGPLSPKKLLRAFRRAS